MSGMTEEKRVEESQESAEMVKPPYVPPTLQRIGSLGELTHTQTKGGVTQDGGGLSRV